MVFERCDRGDGESDEWGVDEMEGGKRMRWAGAVAGGSGFSTETPVEFGERGEARMCGGKVWRLVPSARGEPASASARARSSHFPRMASRLAVTRWEGVGRGVLGECSRRRVWYANGRVGSMVGEGESDT